MQYQKTKSFSPSRRKTVLKTDWSGMMLELFDLDKKTGDFVDVTPDSSSGIASEEHYHASENSESSTGASPFQTSPYEAYRRNPARDEQAQRCKSVMGSHSTSATTRHLNSSPNSDGYGMWSGAERATGGNSHSTSATRHLNSTPNSDGYGMWTGAERGTGGKSHSTSATRHLNSTPNSGGYRMWSGAERGTGGNSHSTTATRHFNSTAPNSDGYGKLSDGVEKSSNSRHYCEHYRNQSTNHFESPDSTAQTSTNGAYHNTSNNQRSTYCLSSALSVSATKQHELPGAVGTRGQCLVSNSKSPTTVTGIHHRISKNSSKPSYSHFDSLRNEIVLRIFTYLKSDDLCRCARVSKNWYKIVWSPILWTKIAINDPTINTDQALKCLTRILSYETPVVCVIVEDIDLRGSEKLTDKGIYLIACRCPELRRLQLEGCSHITNIALFEVVSRCVNLERLIVAGCQYITCISLTPEANIQATTYGKQIVLRYLDMTDCVNLEDSGLQIIVSYCSKLVYLYLRRCTKITDIGIQYLSTYCVSLQELSINDCRNVTDIGLQEISRLEDRLRYLSIAKCDGVSDCGAKAIVRCCTKLRYLNIRGCQRVTDDSIVYLATRCTRLRSLDLGKCGVTDRALFGIAEHSPQLRKLSLRGCEWITDRGVVEIANRCQHLLHINIQDCCLLTIETYKALRRQCQECFIEHTNPRFC